jgi:predicted membrane protein
MKKSTSILWGIALTAAGIVFALNALDITNIDIFFDGWWTLFLIIPCAVGLFTERKKSGNLFGLALGVFLLLCAQDILSFSLLWKLFLPAVVVIAGLKLIFSGLFGKRRKHTVEIEIHVGDGNTAIFGSRDIRYAGEKFTGTKLTCIFGGIDCDLTHAVIEQDCAIDVACIFGGVDLRVPPNVNVQTDIAGIFGGADDQTVSHPGAPTLYIRGACIFGGMDIF